MAISYLSRPVQTAEYIDPIDTQSLSRALLFKQQNFDQGVEAIQNSINTYEASLTSLFRDTDQKYLDNKINQYVDSVNKQYGTADFSERSTVNNVSALGSIIYKDDRIISALKDSKSIGSLVQSYQKLKTDPKLMDKYSKANEDWDMSFVQRYANNPNERFLGSATPTPYVDIDKNIAEVMKGVKAEIVSKVGNDGYITYMKGLGAEKVRTIVQDRLASDPRLATQLGINRWSAYKNATPEQLAAQFQEYKNSKASFYDVEIENLRNKKWGVKAGSKEADLLDKQVQVLETNRQKVLNQSFDDPEKVKAYLYNNQLTDAYIARYGAVETTIKSDPTYIANKAREQREKHFQQTFDFKVTSYNADQSWRMWQRDFAIDKEMYDRMDKDRAYALKLANKDDDSSSDGKNSKVPLNAGIEPGVTPQQKVSDIDAQIYGLQMKNQQLLSGAVLDSIVGNHPELRSEYDNIKRVIGGNVTSASDAYQKIIKSGLSYGVKKAVANMGIGFWRNLDNVAHGALPTQDIRSQQNLPIFTSAVDQLKQNYAEAITLQDQLKTAERQTYASFGISKDKIDAMNNNVARFRRNPNLIPQEYMTKAYNALSHKTGSPVSGAAVGNVNRQEQIDIAIRKYREDITGVKGDKFLEKMAGFIPNTAYSNQMFAFGEGQKKNAINALGPAIANLDATSVDGEIDPVSFAKQKDGSYNLRYRFKENGKDSWENKIINLPENQKNVIEQFAPKGFNTPLPDQGFQRMIQTKGALTEVDGTPMALYTVGNFPIPYSLQKLTGTDDINDTRVQVVLQRVTNRGTGTPNWVRPSAPQLQIFPNAASAREAMNKLAQDAQTTGGYRNVQDLVNDLIK